jgi:16S rRNA processing protein RimM
MVVLGRLRAPWGVQGWIKAESYTDPPAGILDYPVWYLSRSQGSSRHEPSDWEEIRIVAGRPHGDHAVVVSLPGVTDPESARRWVQRDIAVPRKSMPEPEPGQYYWHDLEGCRVVTLAGTELGTVSHLLDMPANAVMVVKQGAQEHWLPAVPKHLKRVDLAARLVTVDWWLDEADDAHAPAPPGAGREEG